MSLVLSKTNIPFFNNQSAIHLGNNSTIHARLKHIDIRYHWIRDALNEKLFELEKIHADHNGFDMLTKALTREKLKVYHFITNTINL